MTVESADDLASLFEEDEFAEAVRYTPPDPGSSVVRCTAIVDRGQGRGRFEAGRSDAVGSERALWVRRAEVGAIQRDGLFEVLDPALLALDPPEEVVTETYRVVGLPVLDQTGAVWAVDLVIED